MRDKKVQTEVTLKPGELAIAFCVNLLNGLPNYNDHRVEALRAIAAKFGYRVVKDNA